MEYPQSETGSLDTHSGKTPILVKRQSILVKLEFLKLGRHDCSPLLRHTLHITNGYLTKEQTSKMFFVEDESIDRNNVQYVDLLGINVY